MVKFNATASVSSLGLQKQKQYDWKDTNMALFGSKTETAIKKASSETETAWNNAGTKVGLQIWRIVKFKVTHWPEEDYGKFYEGDSYIILNTYKEEDSDLLLYDVHFWIGKFSTQDEYGTAAYKTVELDTFLDDRPIQHREVQGHESRLFKSYFTAITILRGGADSGFRKVEPTSYTPRLLHFHGDRRHVEVTEIPRCRDLLDEADVYILDMGVRLYQWNGRRSNKDERFRNALINGLSSDRNTHSVYENRNFDEAASYMNQMKQGRGKCQSETFDEESFNCGAFYNRLNETAEAGEAETVTNQTARSDTKRAKKLYRLSDASGMMQFRLEKEGRITVHDLDTNDVFILDTLSELYVWIGRNTTANEKQNAMVYAHNYLTKTDHPLLPISCVGEGKVSRSFHVALTA